MGSIPKVPDSLNAACLGSNSAVALIKAVSAGGLGYEEGVGHVEGVGVVDGVGEVGLDGNGVSDGDTVGVGDLGDAVAVGDVGDGEAAARVAPQPFITTRGTRFWVTLLAKLSEWKSSWPLQLDQVQPAISAPFASKVSQ